MEESLNYFGPVRTVLGINNTLRELM